MKNEFTEIAFVLDRSGSMKSVAASAIAGFNHFLRDQQNAPGRARLTLVLFDDEYLVPAASLPVNELLPLDAESYEPRGSTALLDAIGRTIDELGARLAALPEADRPVQVIVAILTDGLENASTRFTWHDVSARIRHQRETYQWEFLFLGANQDAIATAAQLSIAAANASAYVADAAGTRSSSRAISRKVSSLRAIAAGRATPSEQADAAAPLREITSNEDEKARRKQ